MERLNSKVLYTIARELYLAERNRQKADHHGRLYESRLTKAESLARGLGDDERMNVGPVQWWVNEEGGFRWSVQESVDTGEWEQAMLPQVPEIVDKTTK